LADSCYILKPPQPTNQPTARQVRTSGHVLLLNWNSQSSAILRQIAAGQVRDMRELWWLSVQ
jgi:hypothetical protein